jgi:regulation of enolase protein 1 (concanavalin A-like superfamily)
MTGLGELKKFNEIDDNHIEVSGNRYRMHAGARKDFFCRPDGSPPILDAPGLAMRVSETVFSLSAKISVEFAAKFDAGALLVRTQAGPWAKLAYELSQLLIPTIVTVVTRDLSDDANGEESDTPSIYLRVYRDHDLFAFHWSREGLAWKLARVFALPAGDSLVSFCFVAQSPTGGGCTATFEDVKTSTRRLDDLRSGA